jgi:hypothetical protein
MVVSLLSILTPACESQAEREQVEAELALFMRNYSVDEYLDANLAYPASADTAQAALNTVPSIIIWAPPGRNPHSPGEFVKLDQPIKVWLFADGQLSEVSDKTAAIDQYRQEYMNYPESESWGFYNFAILSVSSNGQQAEVYLGASGGPMEGAGQVYTLQRSSSGEWEITDFELVWIT